VVTVMELAGSAVVGILYLGILSTMVMDARKAAEQRSKRMRLLTSTKQMVPTTR
jgi:hypothetical protein